MHLELYIGTKAVKAALMTRGEYNALRGWEVPADENPADAGYLVEYTDGGRTNVPGFRGYVSWSPRDVFERAYRRPRGMDFGQAAEAIAAGETATIAALAQIRRKARRPAEAAS